jgi:hypothetical protein
MNGTDIQMAYLGEPDIPAGMTIAEFRISRPQPRRRIFRLRRH